MILQTTNARPGLLRRQSDQANQVAALQAKQSLRIDRFGLAAMTYASGAGLIGTAYLFGMIAAAPAVALVVLILAVNAALYATLRSGLNLRFEDASLTKLQLYLGITILMSALYLADAGRGIGLGLCFVVFLFGVFRLNTREFFGLTLFTLAAYALVLNLQMRLRPEAIGSVHVALFSWLLLAATLPLYAAIGGRLSELRARLPLGNRSLQGVLGRIRNLNARDELTGLPNRAAFTESLRRALTRPEPGREPAKRPIALFLLNVDRFKMINESLGHAIGDQVLSVVAERVYTCVRGHDLVARLDGDEFVVLIDDYESASNLEAIAAKIIQTMTEPMLVGTHELPLSVSIGVAISPEHGEDETTLLRNADAAMYRAKEDGRSGYRIYSAQMNKYAEERLPLEVELRRATARGELRVLYQPKVDIASGKIAGVEALVRWQHPRHGLLAPERFISLAEETGAIIGVGGWVLRETCRNAQRWQEEHGLRIGVAVNLSPRQFHGQTLVADLDAVLAETGFDPTRLDLEITESMVMRNPEQASQQMRQLRDRGVSLSMDDFGTGYSSLGFLKRFPIQNVKIDRSFVRDLPHRADDVAITRAVIAMARSLNLSVIAEGVEREEQVTFLRDENCEEYQGYLCSPPVPEAQLITLLSQPRAQRPAERPAATVTVLRGGNTLPH